MSFALLFAEVLMTAWLLVPLAAYCFLGLIVASVYGDSEEDSGLTGLITMTVLAGFIIYGIASWKGIELPRPTLSDILSLAATYAAVGVVVAFGRWYAYCRKAVRWANERDTASSSSVSRTFPAVVLVDGVLCPSVTAKFKVASWFFYWPFFIISFFLGDVLQHIKDFIVDYIGNAATAIARAASRDRRKIP